MQSREDKAEEVGGERGRLQPSSSGCDLGVRGSVLASDKPPLLGRNRGTKVS